MKKVERNKGTQHCRKASRADFVGINKKEQKSQDTPKLTSLGRDENP